jgi:hypothetical protein
MELGQVRMGDIGGDVRGDSVHPDAMLSQIREDLIEIVEADAQMRPVLPPAGIVVLEIGPTRNLDRKPESPRGNWDSPATPLQTCRVRATRR